MNYICSYFNNIDEFLLIVALKEHDGFSGIEILISLAILTLGDIDGQMLDSNHSFSKHFSNMMTTYFP